MFKVLVNYNFTPEKDWIGDDYLIYDRSDDGRDHLSEFDQEKIVRTENIGNVDYDKLCYLIDNYYELPEVFLWGKTNLFKYISQEEYEKVKDNHTFTPLLTKDHKTYSDTNGVVNYYAGDIYHERADSWFFNQFQNKYVQNWQEWAHFLALPILSYIPFAPGGNYILTRDTVHKYGIDFYKKIASTLPYCQLPVEAQCAERSYYLIWK